ncbi:MAG: HAD family phosphatase [Chitinophagaceae bacterium]|nr:HAD family phosphatase [Chitinophagaceae bacterium]
MAAIKNIIFDLGGVLLNIDFNRTAEAFKQLGVKNFDGFYSKETASDLFEKLETGYISNEYFYAAMQQHCTPGTSFMQVQNAWNAILVGFRKESIGFLSSLKHRYPIYLLSNTNSIHHNRFIELFREETGDSFDAHFIKSYYSHEIQKRKPYKDTYLFVLENGGMNAAETLFIDDAVTNIEGAKKAGLQTHLLLPSERIEGLGL